MNIGSRGRRQAWWRKSPVQPNSFVVRHDPCIPFTPSIPPSFCSLPHWWVLVLMRLRGEWNLLISKTRRGLHYKERLFSIKSRRVRELISWSCTNINSTISITNCCMNYQNTVCVTFHQRLSPWRWMLKMSCVSEPHAFASKLSTVFSVCCGWKWLIATCIIRDTVWLYDNPPEKMIHVYSMKLYAYFPFHFSYIMMILHKQIPVFTQRWK